MSRVTIAGLLAVMVGSLMGGARAEEAAPPKGAYVVLVGVGTYADAAIPARPTAEADARALTALYKDPTTSITTPDRVVLLTSKPDEKAGEKLATKAAIVQALHTAVEQTAPGDTIILGLFGRGSTGKGVNNTAIFLPDTKDAERVTTSLLGADLNPDLRAAKDRNICLLMDVDFTRGDADAPKVKDSIPNLRDIINAIFDEEEEAEGLPKKNKVIFLSSFPSRTPLSKGNHGLFTSEVLQALKGAADAPEFEDGYAPDGVVTVDELVKYIDKEAPKYAREVGKTKLEKETVPHNIGKAYSHFVLSKNPAVAGTVDKQIKAVEALEKAGTISKQAGDEGKALLRKMPKLKAQQELRKQYEALANGGKPEKFLAERTKILEGMKLPSEDADLYARTVMQAIEKTRSGYIKERSIGEWGALALKGFAWRIDEPLPAEVADEIKNPKTLTRSKLQELLRETREALGKREDLDGEKAADMTISMMFFENHDKYSVYFDREEVKKMDATFRGEFRGIGIQIRQDIVRDGLLVVSPIKGSPAHKAGVKAGDLIIEIRRDVDPEGNPLKSDEPKVISTKGMKTEDALKLILGKVGVPVTIVVEREGEKEPREFTIKRGLVAMETVLGVKRDEKDDWTFYLDEQNKIGYVHLSQFAPSTYRDLDAAIRKLQKTGLNGLIIDLRFNPGGLLTQAVAICDMFLDDGLIVSVRSRVREEQKWFDQGIGAYTGFPIVVLVNDKSASASEIVSACLQDYKRAVIIGERTYGKGSVQNIEPFEATGGQIKMTTARYFPPSGRNIDKLSTSGKPEEEWGVKPDKGFDVPLSDDEKDDLEEAFRDRELIGAKEAFAKEKEGKPKPPFKDRQLEKAVEYLKERVKAAAQKTDKKTG